jgi:hypothetical protein
MMSALRIVDWILLFIGSAMAAVLPVWAAYLYGCELSQSGQTWIADLAANGLVFLGLGLTTTLAMFVGPLAIRRYWNAGHGLAGGLMALAWLMACGVNAVAVNLMNPLKLPNLSAEGSPAAIGIAIFFLLVSAVSATLLTAQPELAMHNDTVSSSVSPPHAGGAQEHLWNILKTLANRGPGQVDPRISISDDGTIITSQDALADVTGLSKTSVNRGLKALRLEGRIDLQTTVHGTRIRILGGEQCGTGQETPIGTPGNAIERRERTGPDRS